MITSENIIFGSYLHTDWHSVSISAKFLFPSESNHFRSPTFDLDAVCLFTYCQTFKFFFESIEILCCSCCVNLTVSRLAWFRTFLYSLSTALSLVEIHRFQSLCFLCVMLPFLVTVYKPAATPNCFKTAWNQWNKCCYVCFWAICWWEMYNWLTSGILEKN